MSDYAGTADIHTWLYSQWVAQGTDAEFRAFWPASADQTRFFTLNDQEAAPENPFPYCVMDQTKSRLVARMSGSAEAKRELRDMPLVLHIHTEKPENDTRSPKELAAYLAAKVMELLGGHPTVPAKINAELANGGVLQISYVNDYPVRTEHYHYDWVLEYNIRVDVPVMI